jgi:hypothetical protein
VQKYKKLRTTYHKRALIHLAAKASPTGWPVLEFIQVHWDHMLTCLCSRFIYSDVLSTWRCIIRALYFQYVRVSFVISFWCDSVFLLTNFIRFNKY